MKHSVIIKEPGKKPRHVNISTSLQNLSTIVGGVPDFARIAQELVIIFNPEATEPNANICGFDFKGTIIFLGANKNDWDDLPMTYNEFKAHFPGAFRS